MTKSQMLKWEMVEYQTIWWAKPDGLHYEVHRQYDPGGSWVGYGVIEFADEKFKETILKREPGHSVKLADAKALAQRWYCERLEENEKKEVQK